jgi:hypothetical protein
MPNVFDMGPGGGQWSLMGTNLYTTPFTSYNAFATYTVGH